MLNFKDWFIITESKEEKALALELAGSQEKYNQLLSVIPQNQKYSDPLLVLAAYYLTQSRNLDQTKKDIKDYIELLKNNKMQLIKVNLQSKKPDAPFDNYLHWTQIIHGHQGEEQAKQAKKYTPTDIDFQNEKPIATSPDGLIKVYQSNSPNQCIILGKGRSFCVSQPGNTMWKSYRDTKGSTFYFVYDDSRQDDLSIVVVDANEQGFELTDRVNTTGRIQNPDNPNKRDRNPKIYMDYLKSKGINTNIFQNLPKTQEEIDEDEKLGIANSNLNWFVSLSPQEKSNYIGRGHQLTNEQFDYLWENKFYSLLEQYVKTGLQINDYQIDKIATNKDLKKNYIHNRLIANQHLINLNAKEYGLLNQEEKDKLFKDQESGKVKLALQVGEFEIAKSLVEKGEDIGDALEVPVKNGHLDIVKYLVEKGAEISRDSVRIATENGYLDIVKYLVEKGANITDDAVRYAALNGHLDIVEYLLEKGVDKGVDKDNSLMAAAYGGHLDIVKYLVEKGANITDDAVRYAADNGNLDIVKELVEKGGVIGDSVEYAAAAGHLAVVKYLVEKGGNITDDAVRYAADNGNLDVVNYLNDIKNKKT